MRHLLAVLLFLALPARAEELPPGPFPMPRPMLEPVSAEVRIGVDQVRSRVVWANTAEAHRVDFTLAFQEIHMDDVDGRDVDVARPDAENWLDAALTIDGRPTSGRFTTRAVADGREITPTLRRLGIPLQPFASTLDDRLDLVSRADAIALRRAGAVHEEDGAIFPAWRVQTTAVWTVTVPRGGQVVVDHRHVPAVELVDVDVEDVEDGGALRRDFCIDEATAGRLADRMRARGGRPLTGTILVQDLGGPWKPRTHRLLVEAETRETVVASCLTLQRRLSGATYERNGLSDEDTIAVLFVP